MRCNADVIVYVEGVKDPMLPEVLMLEINHASETLREVIEDCATYYLLILIENRNTHIAPLEQIQ